MIKKDGLFSAGDMTQSDRCLHTPGTFAKQNLMYVQEVGRLQSLQPHRCIRENLDSYLFLIVLEGRGCLEIKGRTYEVSKGSCAFIDCMEHYEHISDEQDAWKLAWVHFNGQAAKGYYELFLKYNEGSNVFPVEDEEFWNAQIGELLNRQKNKNLQSELQCGELLLHLLNNIIANVSNRDVEEQEQEKQLANELREFLKEQYVAVDVLHELESKFGENAKELGAVFARQFGIGLEEYINHRRFNAAKELLRFSIKPVEEIAIESGIGDVTTMQMLFQDSEGMSAEEYRKKWAAWIR